MIMVYLVAAFSIIALAGILAYDAREADRLREALVKISNGEKRPAIALAMIAKKALRK